MLAQQSEEHKQRPTTTATTSSTAVSASGLIRSAHRLHASRRHSYIQLSAATTTTTTTTSASVSAGTTSTSLYLSTICDTSVHTSTSHLRHHFHQQRVRLQRRTTTRHRRTSSPLRHQPAESLLGLHDIFDSGIILHINGKDNSSVEHQGESEPLYHHRSHLFIDAMAFDIDHRVHHHWVQYIQRHGFYSDQYIMMNSDEPQHLAGEAQQPQTLRSPILPSQQEQDTHALTQQPYWSWCRVCQQTKGHGGQHRRQRQQDESVSIIQLDYTFMHDPRQSISEDRQASHLHDTHGHRAYITGLGVAVLTSQKGYRPHQASQLHHWIIKHGFAKSVLQSDHETSLMQLVGTVATDLKLPTSVSPPYSHQSQGKVERFHRNLFDQLRTTRLQWSKDLNMEPRMLPPESLPRSDDIDFNTRERFNNLQKQNIATRDLQLQQPQDEEDIEQPQGVQPPVLRHHPQEVAPLKNSNLKCYNLHQDYLNHLKHYSLD